MTGVAGLGRRNKQRRESAEHLIQQDIREDSVIVGYALGTAATASLPKFFLYWAGPI